MFLFNAGMSSMLTRLVGATAITVVASGKGKRKAKEEDMSQVRPSAVPLLWLMGRLQMGLPQE